MCTPLEKLIQCFPAMLVQCWSSLLSSGPTLSQHCVNISLLVGSLSLYQENWSCGVDNVYYCLKDNPHILYYLYYQNIIWRRNLKEINNYVRILMTIIWNCWWITSPKLYFLTVYQWRPASQILFIYNDNMYKEANELLNYVHVQDQSKNYEYFVNRWPCLPTDSI